MLLNYHICRFFSVRCVLEIWCGWVWVEPDVVIKQHSRKLLMMDILISETCWVHKKWNKIKSDIKLVFHSSTITMMHGPINISGWSLYKCVLTYSFTPKVLVIDHFETSIILLGATSQTAGIIRRIIYVQRRYSSSDTYHNLRQCCGRSQWSESDRR